MVDAIIFDLDGVLIDSEQLWSSAREQVAREHGGTWTATATRAMMGMSSREWSRYMHDELHVEMTPDAISSEVIERLEALYREGLPLLPGAVDAVAALRVRWRLGLASSANREIIALVLELADLARLFDATVSSEEVAHGKPAPDVYLEAARRLGARPAHCVAVEDSTSGLRAAVGASLTVVAIPNRHFPPEEDALRLADVVVDSLDELRPELIDRIA
jgi:HAD superfamily hydrolase (TIGR01509 family)